MQTDVSLLRQTHPEASARKIHELLVKQRSDVTLSDVKRACSKLMKSSAKKTAEINAPTAASRKSHTPSSAYSRANERWLYYDGARTLRARVAAGKAECFGTLAIDGPMGTPEMKWFIVTGVGCALLKRVALYCNIFVQFVSKTAEMMESPEAQQALEEARAQGCKDRPWTKYDEEIVRMATLIMESNTAPEHGGSALRAIARRHIRMDRSWTDKPFVKPGFYMDVFAALCELAKLAGVPERVDENRVYVLATFTSLHNDDDEMLSGVEPSGSTLGKQKTRIVESDGRGRQTLKACAYHACKHGADEVRCSTVRDAYARERRTHGLMPCARCLKVQYCCTECQAADWDFHRLSCAPVGQVVKEKVVLKWLRQFILGLNIPTEARTSSQLVTAQDALADFTAFSSEFRAAAEQRHLYMCGKRGKPSVDPSGECE